MSDNNATVSVVIPTVGRQSLVRAMESARSQQGVAIDLIVVLDRPELANEVRDMVGESGRLILTDGAVGGSVARNLGAANSRGDYVAFLDDDDWWSPEKLTLQIAQMVDAGATWAWSSAYFIRGLKTEVVPRRLPRADENLVSYLVQRPRLRYGDCFIQSSSLILTAAVASRVKWDETLLKHQDWDLVARLDRADVGNWTSVIRPLVFVEQQKDGSVSRARSWQSSMSWFEVHRRDLSARARADFLVSHVLRGALATMDMVGVRAAWSELAHCRPHAAAMVVGLSGVIEYLRSKNWVARVRVPKMDRGGNL